MATVWQKLKDASGISLPWSSTGNGVSGGASHGTGTTKSTSNTSSSIKASDLAMQKNMQNAVSNKTAYLPTSGATSNTYLDIAYNPESQKLANKNLQYSAVTANGSSYIPTASIDKSKLTYPDKNNGNGTGGGNGGGTGSGGISGYANFQASQAYNDAMAYTNQLLSQLNSGRTSYTDQINSLMDSINNRASFSYDPDTDPLFQSYLASSMESGKTAMTDTMAQASALTGGYGSTYATAAANGAYNSYIQDAYNNLPEYYQTALDTYNSETNDLYSKLGMYNTADQIEYDRLANAYQNNFAMANDMYGKEYNNYWDSLNYNTSIDQYNQDLAYKYYSLAQDQKQFEAKQAAEASANASSSSATSGRDLSDSELRKILEIYNKDELDAGGWEGVYAYLDSFSEPVNVENVASYINQYGRKRNNEDKYNIKAAVRGY